MTTAMEREKKKRERTSCINSGYNQETNSAQFRLRQCYVII